MKPIFIMSSERSGSNLVRRMFAAHSAVAAPPPPHLWRIFQPLLMHYGPLDVESNWRELLADMLEMTRVPNSHLAWKHELTADEVAGRIRTHSLTGIAGALYESYAAREDASAWTCKENNLFDHALRIIDVFPEARFLYLCRDGRDVACSIRKIPTHDQHPYFIAKEWCEEQAKCIGVHQDLLDSGRSTILRYEELIEAPEQELRRLCEFIGLEYDSNMMEFHQERESKEDANKTEYWKNLDQPVIASNKAKFLTELTRSEIGIFENVAADTLEILGYPLHVGRSRRRSGLERWFYRVQNRHQKRAKFKRLQDEPGRKERAQTMRTINRSRRASHPPLVNSLTYENGR